MYWTCFSLFLTAIMALSIHADEINPNRQEVETMENLAVPQYLYKILSLRNWQATQNRNTVALPGEDHDFIHFSKEEQLEKIVAKYWSNVPEYVVLKIDANRLAGEMVYETNPGGSTQYYHLYNGFIPIQAIVESRIVYCTPRSAEHQILHELNIVQMGDPVLRQMARPLSEKEILSQQIQELIQNMKAVMRAAPGVGLAAPQIGQSIQLIVVEDMDHSHLTAQQLLERDRVKVPFHVIINPQIYIEETDTAEFFEGCLSVPVFLGVVPRAKTVRVECLDENANPVVIQARGWYARILQHEIDHLKGILFLDRAHLRTLMTEENYVKLWKEKNIGAVKTGL